MQINISARHGHLSESTQEQIRAKVDKLNRYFDRLMAIDVICDLEHQETIEVEVILDAEHKHDFVAKSSGGDLMGALDTVVHKLEQQVKRYKEKIQDHRNDPKRGQELPTGEPQAEE